MGQETAAGATIEAANIRSRDQKDYLAELRGGNMVETARKNIMADITKANPYADEPTRQRLFQTEWSKALQSNPALAKYAGVASGGGGASSADPLGLR
jgi:propanediol dehydratase small subunit